MSLEDIRVAFLRGYEQGKADGRAEATRRTCPKCSTSWSPTSMLVCPACDEPAQTGIPS